MGAQKIYKYPINDAGPDGIVRVSMPRGARMLSVQVQSVPRRTGDVTIWEDAIFAWALVDPDAETVKRRFQVVPTGLGPTNPEANYLGTVQLRSEHLVFHIFDMGTGTA